MSGLTANTWLEGTYIQNGTYNDRDYYMLDPAKWLNFGDGAVETRGYIYWLGWYWMVRSYECLISNQNIDYEGLFSRVVKCNKL